MRQHKRSFAARYLNPGERLNELLFALIMALSITLGVGLASSLDSSTHQIVWAILGCNLAWGLIDACNHVLTKLFSRSAKARLVQALRTSHSEAEQIEAVGSVLNENLSAVATEDERQVLYLEISRRLQGGDLPPTRVLAEDIYSGLAIVWLMVLASVPAILPFLIIGDRFWAARVSNGLVLLSMFAAGYGFALSANTNPWRLAFLSAVFGLTMVVIVILLGG